MAISEEREEEKGKHMNFREIQKQFGQLLRHTCEEIEISQGLLSRESKKLYKNLVQSGTIEDMVLSLDQPAISRVMDGKQHPNYYQMYIWMTVIEKHAKNKNIIINSKNLWQLSGFARPEEIAKAYEETKDLHFLEQYPSLIEHKEKRWQKGK